MINVNIVVTVAQSKLGYIQKVNTKKNGIYYYLLRCFSGQKSARYSVLFSSMNLLLTTV